MSIDRYVAISNESHSTYEFLSTGPRGTVKKIVKYTQIEPNVYNLGFGDWDERAQKVRDDVRTNNDDRDRVLATVAFTAIDFMTHHPGAILFAQGNTLAKTRLYQMGIQNNLDEISEEFDVKGFINGNWEDFEKGKNYQAFAVIAR